MYEKRNDEQNNQKQSRKLTKIKIEVNLGKRMMIFQDISRMFENQNTHHHQQFNYTHV